MIVYYFPVISKQDTSRQQKLVLHICNNGGTASSTFTPFPQKVVRMPVCTFKRTDLSPYLHKRSPLVSLKRETQQHGDCNARFGTVPS